MNYPYLEFLKLALPEAVLVIAVLLVLVADLAVLRGQPVPIRMGLIGGFAAFGCAAAILALLVFPVQGRLPEGMLTMTPLTGTVKVAILLLGFFTVLIARGSFFTPHVGEFFALVLLATLGFMFVASAENLLAIFVALELSSLSLYILTAFDKRNPQSAEAAMKYFLFGGMAAAFLLFGLSLLYGVTGSLHLPIIAERLRLINADTLVIVSMVMILTGFGFKIAVVPFHLWAPDAYQGAPAPAAALIASGSKVAAFYVLGQVLMIGLDGVGGSAAWRQLIPGWMPLLAILATLSMILGNLGAIVQTEVRRLLAYSAIAHGGYALIALLAEQPRGMAAMLYYVITYGFTLVGSFGIVAVVERHTGGSRFEHFTGLARRSPWLAFALMIFLLSLAGIPPMAGFFGKFYVFTAALQAGHPKLGLLWLVILAIAMSVVSLYYYLQVLKQAYDANHEGTRMNTSPIPVVNTEGITILLLAALVLLLGCFPDLLFKALAI